ncbi:hypothetical protein QA798_17200 [Mycolicibacterium fortuitum]|nr:hypothetical protein [Mycolicibacterium fortuitum]
MSISDDIATVLKESPEPLTVGEIAARTGGVVSECDAALWGAPERFVWQPGHRWTAANPKSRAQRKNIGGQPDVRSNVMSAHAPRELRALTLSSGLTIAVNRHPIDTDAFFTVRSAGNTITLTLNSTHELFAELPTPFEVGQDEASYKQLCEILLSAWALYEDGLPGGSARRVTEDARLLWGRRAIEMLREREP